MENPTPTALLSWKARIRPHHKRGLTWFIVMGLLLATLIAYSMYTEAWSFTTILIMTATAYWFIHRVPFEDHTISLYEWGFLFDDRPVEWKDCTGYWFLGGPGYHELHIEHTKKVLGRFVIQTGNLSIEEIHDVLTQFLPELEDKVERPLDTISRICKI